MKLRILLRDGSERSGTYTLEELLHRLAYVRDEKPREFAGWTVEL